MGAFLRKYGTGTGADIYLPMIKRGVVDQAVGADWTPAAGDVKLSIDGAAAANIGTLPTAIAMGNGAEWKFVFADAELQGKRIVVVVADSATKAVEDQFFVIETYGHASAMYKPDFSDSVRLGLTALPNAAADAAGGLPISDAGGLDLDTQLGKLVGTLATGTHQPQSGDSYPIVSSATYGNAALKTLIDAVDNYVDTEMAAAISAIATAQANLDILTGVDGVTLATLQANYAPAKAGDAMALTTGERSSTAAAFAEYPTALATSPNTLGRAIVLGGNPIEETTISGSSTPSTTVMRLNAGPPSANALIDHTIFFISGACAGESKVIVAYSGSPNYQVTLDEALTTAPTAADQVSIGKDHTHTTSSIATAVTAGMDANSTKLAAIVADTSELQSDWADGGRLDLILDARASQSSVDTLATYIDTEVAAILEDTGTTIPAQISALFTTALTESYRADGATGTPAQILYELLALNGEFAISGTTKQHKKLDGTTNAFASTLDDATNPTAITRA